jgi:hypothetical protein
LRFFDIAYSGFDGNPISQKQMAEEKTWFQKFKEDFSVKFAVYLVIAALASLWGFSPQVRKFFTEPHQVRGYDLLFAVFLVAFLVGYFLLDKEKRARFSTLPMLVLTIFSVSNIVEYVITEPPKTSRLSTVMVAVQIGIIFSNLTLWITFRFVDSLFRILAEMLQVQKEHANVTKEHLSMTAELQAKLEKPKRAKK